MSKTSQFSIPSSFEVAAKKSARATKRNTKRWAKSAKRKTQAATKQTYADATKHLAIQRDGGGNDPF